MRHAFIYPRNLGFTLVIQGMARRFDTMSALVDFCNENNINAYYSYNLYFDYNGNVNPSYYTARSGGLSLRCVQEIQ